MPSEPWVVGYLTPLPEVGRRSCRLLAGMLGEVAFFMIFRKAVKDQNV